MGKNQSKNYKAILIIGSIGIDQIINMDEIPQLGAVKEGELETIPGGKGNLEAIACGKAGGDVEIIGVIGDDYKETIQKTLENNNVNHILTVLKGVKTHYANIVIGKEGNNRIAINSGADAYFHNNIIDQNIDYIENARIIIFQLEIPLKTVKYAIDVCYQKRKVIILRPSIISDKNNKNKVDLSEDTIKKVTYLITNESELSKISNMPTSNEKEIDEASKKIMDMGAQNLIVILVKKGGCLLWKKGEKKETYNSYYKEKIVDGTGASDCFIGVFAAFLSKNTELDEAIRYANLATSICVSKEGTIGTFPKLEELNREKEKINNW